MRPWFGTVPGLMVVLLLAGCGAQIADVSKTETSQLETTGVSSSGYVSPEPTPQRPEELSRSNVVQFVSELERTTIHNRLVGDKAIRINVRCNSYLHAVYSSSYYIESTCTGYADYEDSHVDLGRSTASYFINKSGTIRINDFRTKSRPPYKVLSSNNSSRNFLPPYQPAEIRISNFDNSSFNVSLSVRHVGQDRSKIAINESYRIDSKQALVQRGVTKLKGEYEVMIQLDNKKVEQYSWNLTSPSTTPVLHIYVSPNATIISPGIE